MRIVDAQIHLWGSGLPSNMAHRQVTSFTTEEAVALMDEGGVDAAVIHPPGWDPNSTEMAFRAPRAQNTRREPWLWALVFLPEEIGMPTPEEAGGSGDRMTSILPAPPTSSPAPPGFPPS
jgi:predicted TIM-barrel fold metal-dependent hydrolase